MTKNHFATLGLKPGAKEDDIKKAYRTLAKQWHPDKNKQVGAEEKFKEISAAYEYLKCENRREILERDLNKPKQSESTSTFNFKSEFKSNHNGESESYWSKKFGQKSENRYKNSTFTNFADEGREPPFTKKKEQKTNQKNNKKHSKPNNKHFSHAWNNMDDHDEFYDIPQSSHSARSAGSRPNFSFAFKSFVDDLGMSFDAFFMGPSMNEPFQFSSFFDGPDPFMEFFRQGSLFSLRKGPSPRRPRKHEVAPEEGAEGLDPEYMFSPPTTQRSASSYSNKENVFTDKDTTTKDESDDDDMDSRLFKCTYCERRMPFSQLSTHEPGCALRCGGKFDATSEDEYDNFEYESPEEDQYPQKSGDWRQTHQELLRNIRRAKAKARHSAGSRMTSDTNKSTTEEHLAQTRCKWCGRYFSNPAARHHIPFCEKWTKEHGTPLNPAGKTPARDKGSKSQKAREYAKHIPKPRAHSEEKSFESDSSSSPRATFDNFQDFQPKRETMTKQTASSGTGLHSSSSYNPRDKNERPAGGTGFTRASFAQPGKPTSTATGAGRYSSMNGETSSSTFRTGAGLGDSYGFGISGSRLKPDMRPSGLSPDSCPICVKKYGVYGRFVCSCGGRRKTGA